MATFLGPGASKPRRRLVAILGWAALAIVVALRLLTLARDTWEWDELLFVGAARDGLDVRVNHPHPPGYPLFVLPARLLVLLGASPFPATLATAVAAGFLAIVLLVALARELGAGREEALWAGLLWACIPSVWLHSVRPLSDASGAAAFLLAALLLARAERLPDGRGLFAAALAVGACAGVRPQVAIALLPLALVVALRAFRTPAGVRRAALAAGAGLAAGLLPYVPVVAGSGGLREYLSAARVMAEYVRSSDAPALPALGTAALWGRWLVDPFGGPLPAAAAWLAAAGIAVSARASRLVAIVFLPLLAFSVTTLNPVTAPRYVIALLAAAPLAAAVGLTRLRARRRRLAAVLATALLAVVALPAVPALVEVARRPSPPVAAMAALCTEPGLVGRPLLVAPGLYLHRAELGPKVPSREIELAQPVVAPPGSLVVTHDGGLPGLHPVRDFRFGSEALGRISRGRYLSVTIRETAPAPAPDRVKTTDHQLPASVDEPAEGATVRSPVHVRGWCQERGGVTVVPVEFRVDGVAVAPERIVRTPRRDVQAAIAGIGDASRAGFEALLPAGAVPPGVHVLEVVFETSEKLRVYSPRTFTVAATPLPTRGSS